MFNFVQNFKNASLKSFRVDLPDEYASRHPIRAQKTIRHHRITL